MDVILLERVGKLGQMGDIVSVKPGYARNFLLPQGKALRATKANRAYFEEQRAQLEATNLAAKSEAEAVGEKLAGELFIAIRQAGDSGQLYGSVSTRDVAVAVTEGGFTIERRQVVLDTPIKQLGLHDVTILLHPEVEVAVVMNVARSEDEAERQARGEDVTIAQDEEDEDEEIIHPEDVFEDEALAEEAIEELEADAAEASADDDEASETEAEAAVDGAGDAEDGGDASASDEPAESADEDGDAEKA